MQALFHWDLRSPGGVTRSMLITELRWESVFQSRDRALEAQGPTIRSSSRLRSTEPGKSAKADFLNITLHIPPRRCLNIPLQRPFFKWVSGYQGIVEKAKEKKRWTRCPWLKGMTCGEREDEWRDEDEVGQLLISLNDRERYFGKMEQEGDVLKDPKLELQAPR